MDVNWASIAIEDMQEEVERIRDIIAEKCDPEKIILFGSMATGNYGIYSDIDLAVIMETDLRFIDRLLYLARLTNPKIGIDFLVYTPKEFASMLEQGNLFLENEVLEGGRVVYERC